MHGLPPGNQAMIKSPVHNRYVISFNFFILFLYANVFVVTYYNTESRQKEEEFECWK
jgi:hypothetical protein